MGRALTTSTLGPYRVEARIGSGGMGVVYRGRHLTLGHAAALKTVHVASPEQVAAFRREVQVLAELEHPGIVRILEQGLSSGTPWYAMELVEGRALSTLLRGPLASETELVLGSSQRGTASLTEDSLPAPRSVAASSLPSGERYRDRPPLAELLAIVRKVCKALAFLHAHGLVHRDLKPDNILIQADGNPVLVDFGIVGHFGDKAGREVLKLTRSAGTLAYMAPEQALGRLVDARADLFSLGCILYECIVDELPFGPSGLYDPSLPAPPLPSSRVAGVSPELDRLVMGLLARDVRERLGYAEDVAAALERLSPESRTESAPQVEAAYLYRPEFAGRQAPLERLCALLERARLGGTGALALITGESGLGKTRLVLELGARAVAASMTVLTGECTPVGAQRLDDRVRGEPLHPFRNFLVAVADASRAAAPEVRTRLLGEHAQVLAPYEPALAGALADDQPALEALSPERARARVFTALDALLEAFALERPLLLLLDDLQWADSLTLEFLALRADRAAPDQRSRVSLIATCRSEEMSDELNAWSAHPHVTIERLERFDREAVGEMVSGMLAVATPPVEWIAFLEQESGGNPFFIAEYLRAAIAERLLTRTNTGRWTLGKVSGSSNLRERLGLPSSIAELVGRRLRGLDEAALQVVRAAAVLGREFDLELLGLTAGVAQGGLSAAYAGLRRRQILQDESAGSSGFVHDKLREIAYDLLEVGERSELHRRAAAALESRFAGNEGALDFGTLGHHHARAGAAARAAVCFERAALRARQSYANRDAERFYRLALAELARLPQTAELRLEGGRLHETLAELLIGTSRFEEARTALDTALALTTAEQRVLRARRCRLLARTWERVHEHERALALLERAESELGTSAADDEGDGYWFEQLEIQIQATWHLYFLSRVSELSELIERVRPAIERRGTPRQRSRFFQAVLHMHFRRDRYQVSAESLALARTALAAAEQANDADDLALARFHLAFALTFGGGELEAGPLYRLAIARVERVGDASLQARFLSYYTILHRRLGHTAETRSLAARALGIAQQHGFVDYIGVAHANLAWVAGREGGDVDAAVRDALSAWERLPNTYPYPLQWLARAPLAMHLAQSGRHAQALDQWEILLDPSQSCLPDALRSAIEVALAKRSQHAAVDLTMLASIEALASAHRYL